MVAGSIVTIGPVVAFAVVVEIGSTLVAPAVADPTEVVSYLAASW